MKTTWLPMVFLLILCGCSPATDSSTEHKVKRQSADVRVDDFGLPLVIVMEVPEVPPEISRPTKLLELPRESPAPTNLLELPRESKKPTKMLELPRESKKL